MDYTLKRKLGRLTPAKSTRPDPSPPVHAAQRKQQPSLQRALLDFTAHPVTAQRAAAGPVLLAATWQRQQDAELQARRAALQRQLAAGPAATPEAVQAARQRQEAHSAPLGAPLRPGSSADWVTVMRAQAQQMDGRRVSAHESAQFSALQRQVAHTLARNFRQDRQPPQQRYDEYGTHLAALQGHDLSGQVAQVTLGLLPLPEQPAVRRAVAGALQREAAQRAEDDALLRAHALQRQLAELDAESARPALHRIQERRGAGNPLPEGVQRHLEQGLNHDLSGVRIHDDAEANKLAKKVNAVAFTTGSDIYFQSGKFNPNTRSGLELLAHEVTHTVQQAQGKVGPGVDPDSGLEQEARQTGEKLAAQPLPAQAPGAISVPAGTAPASAAGHRGTVQRLKAPEHPTANPAATAPSAPASRPELKEKAKPETPAQAKVPEPAPEVPVAAHQDASAPQVLPQAPAVEVQAAPDVDVPSFDTQTHLAQVADVPAAAEITLPDLPEVTVAEPAQEAHTGASPEPAAEEAPAIQRAAAPGAAKGLTPAQARANARAAAGVIAAAANAAAARVNSSASSSAAQITSQARTQGQGVLSVGRSQANAVRSAAQQSQNQIRQSAARATSNIRSKAQSSTAKLAAQHAAGAAKAAQAINASTQKVTSVANQHASKAVQSANQEAGKATSKAQSTAAQVRGRAPGSSSIAPEVGQAKTSAGNQIAAAATGQIMPAGTQIANVTKQAGNQVSRGVQQKGAQLASHIRAQGPRATQQLNAQRQAATQAVTQGAAQASTQLNAAASQAGSKVASSAAQAQANITQGAAQQATRLQTAGQQAAARVKQQGQATGRATQAAANRIRAMLASSELSAADAGRLRASAVAQLQRASGTLSGKARSSSQKALSGLQQQAGQLRATLQRVGPQASSKLKQASGQVSSKLGGTVGKVTPGFNQITQGHQRQTQKLTQQLGTKLSASVTKTGSLFQQGQGKLTATLSREVGKETQKIAQAGSAATANIASSHARADQKAQSEKARIDAEAKAKEAAASRDKSLWDKARDKLASVWESIKKWVTQQWEQMKATFTSPGFIAGLVTGLVLGAAVALTIGTGGLALPMLIAVGAGIGAISAGVGTVVQNLADKEPLDKNLIKNVLIGGGAGGLLAALPAGAALAGGFTLSVGGGIAQNVLSDQPWDTNLLGNIIMGGVVPFAGKKLLGNPARPGAPRSAPTSRAGQTVANVTGKGGPSRLGAALRNLLGRGRRAQETAPGRPGLESRGYKPKAGERSRAAADRERTARQTQRQAAYERFVQEKMAALDAQGSPLSAGQRLSAVRQQWRGLQVRDRDVHTMRYHRDAPTGRLARIDELAGQNYRRLLKERVASQKEVYRYTTRSTVDRYYNDPAQPGIRRPSYMTDERFGDNYLSMDRAQVAPEWGIHNVRVTVPRSALVGDPILPRPFGNSPHVKVGWEPFTKAYPQYGRGGALQFLGRTERFDPRWVASLEDTYAAPFTPKATAIPRRGYRPQPDERSMTKEAYRGEDGPQRLNRSLRREVRPGDASQLSQPGGLSATEGTRVTHAAGGRAGQPAPASHPLGFHGPDVPLSQIKARVGNSQLTNPETGSRYVRQASRFMDRSKMEAAAAKLQAEHQQEIQNWLSGNPPAGENRAFISSDLKLGNLGEGFHWNRTTGTVDKIQAPLNGARIVLKSDGRGGYVIQTLFPQ